MSSNKTIRVHGREVPVPPEMANYTGQGSGLLTVFEAGAWAAALGMTDADCKYKPGRGSGARRKAWMKGFSAWKTSSPPRERMKEAVA